MQQTSRDDHFRFSLVFIKKNNQTEIKKKPKPNQNRFKPTGFGLVRFSSVFREKTVQTGVA